MQNGVRDGCGYIELIGVVPKRGPAQDVTAIWRGLDPDRR